MRPGIAIALATSALLAAAPAAVASGPHTLRRAQAHDLAPRPSAWAEWWVLRAMPRRGRGVLELQVRREGVHTDVALYVSTGRRYAAVTGDGERPSGGAARLELRHLATALAVRRHGRRLHAALKSGDGAADVQLRDARGGPAALGWRLGPYGGGPPSLAWSVPIADSRLTAAVRPAGAAPITIRGWRASYEHGWGAVRFSEPGIQWRFWEQDVVHAAHGVTWLLHGLDPGPMIVGPGARDAQWLGVLARVDRHGLRICHARIDRRGWMRPLLEAEPAPRVTRARCGGMAVTFRDGRRLGVGEDRQVWVSTSPTRARGGQGRAWHLTPDLR